MFLVNICVLNLFSINPNLSPVLFSHEIDVAMLQFSFDSFSATEPKPSSARLHKSTKLLWQKQYSPKAALSKPKIYASRVFFAEIR
jgi:hypothetical protein